MYKNIFITNATEIESAKIYLWGDGRHDDDGLKIHDYAEFNYAYKQSSTGNMTSIHGQKLKKVYNFKWHDKNLYESDVPRDTRVLTDLYLNDDSLSKDVYTLFFDIEVSSEGGFAIPEKATNEITAIANYYQKDDKYIVFLLDKDGKIENKIENNVEIKAFKTEKELLSSWLEYYSTIKPEIITGWNTDGYDIPYLYNRLKIVFDTDTANMLSPVGLVKYNSFKNKYQLAGVSSLDYQPLYKKFTYTKMPNYRLDTIGKHEVKMGKIEYEGSLDMLFKNDLPKFIEYNLQDVRIVVALDKKKKLIDMARAICHTGRVPYEEFGSSSKFIEGTMLVYLHKINVIAPNKMEGHRDMMTEKYENDEEGFDGAFVKPPMPGLYEWVYNLDLQSLYPSIIMSLNISPETKIGYIKNWDIKNHNKKKIEKYLMQSLSGEMKELNRDEFIKFMIDGQLSISSNGVLYDIEKKGIIPSILDSWFKQRLEYKDLKQKYKKEKNTELTDYYDMKQHVQKIFLNSVYGVLGLPSFRFYDLDNAEAVTTSGQYIIKSTSRLISNKYKECNVQNKTEEWLYKYEKVLLEAVKKKQLSSAEVPELLRADDHCIYIDTDSVYFSSVPLLQKYNINNEELTIDKCKNITIQISSEIESMMNEIYSDFAMQSFFCKDSRFVIKSEIIAETALWVIKKRYMIKKTFDMESKSDVEEKDKWYIKGLDIIRSSFPPAFQEFTKELLTDILNKKQKEELDEKILSFKQKLFDMPFERIAKNTSVSGMSEYDTKSKSFDSFPSSTPAHVKSAICYNRFLKYHKLDKKHEPIRDGDKIKWMYIKQNSLGIEQIALKGYDDPPLVVKFLNEYMDIEKQFDAELKKKLQKYYDVMEWGTISTNVNQKAKKFLSFKK